MKTEEEYFENNGWSSHHFLEHAKFLLPKLKEAGIKPEIKRSVLYLSKEGCPLIKAYVHYNGRSREYLTFTKNRGQEIATFHCTHPADSILKHILLWFEFGFEDKN